MAAGGASGKKKRTKRPTRRSVNREGETKDEVSKVPKNDLPRRKAPAPVTEEDSMLKKPTLRTSRLSAQKEKISPEVEAVCQDFVDHHLLPTVREEFKIVVEMLPEGDKHKDCFQFKQRKRYEDVPCFDATRVKVIEPSEPGCNFIHANKIAYEKADHDYILAQAPLQNSLEDFWRVIFQENCSTIALLCPFYEQGKESAEPFWPQATGEYKYYGKMFINNKKTETKDATNIYMLEVLSEGCSNSIITTIHHYTTWEANSITTPRSVLRLRNSLKLGESGPLTVICSEAINRAPCFVAIDIVLVRLFKGVKTRRSTWPKRSANLELCPSAPWKSSNCW